MLLSHDSTGCRDAMEMSHSRFRPSEIARSPRRFAMNCASTWARSAPSRGESPADGQRPAEERAGRASGDRDLQAEGQGDRMGDAARQVGEHAKDAGADVRDAFKK
jgi:uncharacterized protein YjbJ (UPF0337 family)